MCLRSEDVPWIHPNAPFGEQSTESFDFYGKPAWCGEPVTHVYWYLKQVKHYTGIYGGSAAGPVMLCNSGRIYSSNCFLCGCCCRN